MSHSPTLHTDHYIVHHRGKTEGPFTADFIEAMIMSGVYPPSVIVESSVTSKKTKFEDISAAQQACPSPESTTATGQREPSANSMQQGATNSSPMKIFYVVIVVIGIASIAWIFSINNTSVSSNKSKSVKSSITPIKTTYTPKKKTSTLHSSKSNTSRSRYSKPTSGHSKSSSRYSIPSVTPSPANTMLYRDEYGRTYRLSDYDYRRLSIMKSSLSAKSTSVGFEKSRLSSMANEVDRARIGLDRTSQYAIDSFNRKVGQVNTMNRRVQNLVDDYNQDVNAFNRELESVGTLIR